MWLVVFSFLYENAHVNMFLRASDLYGIRAAHKLRIKGNGGCI